MEILKRDSTRGKNTREALKSARGKGKGAKVARTGAKIDAQISYLSHKIERAEAQRNARRAKRNK